MTEPDSPHRLLDPFEREACELLLTSVPAGQPSGSVTPSQRLEQRGINSPDEALAQPEMEELDLQWTDPSGQLVQGQAFTQEWHVDWHPGGTASSSHAGRSHRSLPAGTTFGRNLLLGDLQSVCTDFNPNVRANSAPAASMTSSTRLHRSSHRGLTGTGQGASSPQDSQTILVAGGRISPAGPSTQSAPEASADAPSASVHAPTASDLPSGPGLPEASPQTSQHGRYTSLVPAASVAAPSASAQTSTSGLPELNPRAAQYGGRAKLQLRSAKRQAVKDEASTSAQDPSRDVRQAAKRRPPPVQSLTEMEVAANVESLQQPAGPASGSHVRRLETIQHLTDLTRLPGSELSHPNDDLRRLSLQRMHVHPGWHAVVPCESSIAMVYLSLETGNLDLGIDLEPAGQKVSTVRELLQVPSADMQRVILSSIQTCANAKAFKREDMDECHLSMMRHAGMLGLLCSVSVTCQQVDPTLTGKALLDMQTGPAQQPPDFDEVKTSLRLAPQQVVMARKIWHMVCSTVEQLESERQALLSSVCPVDVQPSAWQQPTGLQPTYLSRVMDRAAKLTDNARLQQEVVRNAGRLWFWEANNPDTGARIICRSSPGCPDVFGTLRVVGST
ncbi:hypothetical protein WJX74_002108 [Apatococcus lobatus]|uniref:Uncharacterized protein n=1 Tax=Apatococcus lobatus TaxID=904363 RepID=A0AAW1RRX3_9CHLO